jgi:hypothetical protein
MALFLIVAGLTGACLAFYKPLDRWLAPRMYEAPARGAVLDPFMLLEKVQAQAPGRRTDMIRFGLHEGEAVIFYLEPGLDPAPGEPYIAEHDEYAFDPVSGALLASRGPWGSVPTSLDGVMSFLYALHYKLALPGRIGLWLFGVAAIFWTVDCFVGVYLTFPRGRAFWRKWRPARGLARPWPCSEMRWWRARPSTARGRERCSLQARLFSSAGKIPRGYWTPHCSRPTRPIHLPLTLPERSLSVPTSWWPALHRMMKLEPTWAPPTSSPLRTRFRRGKMMIPDRLRTPVDRLPAAPEEENKYLPE